MFKALIKKQLLELNQFYFRDRKNNTNRSKSGIIGMVILFAFVFLTIMGSLLGMGMVLAGTLSKAGLSWLYFAIFGIFTILIGVFGSVFNTYNGLYLAKDNELLLAMPIKPGMILLARVIGLAVMSLLFSFIVWVPAAIAYCISAKATPLSVLFQVLLLVVITAFVMVLTCILGWVVAKLSVKFKRNRIISLVVTLIFVGGYYFVCMRMSSFIEVIAQNGDVIADALKSWGYPLYIFGRAATGEVLPMLAVTGVVAVLFFITYLVLSRSFIKIVTTSTGEGRIKGKKENIGQQKISKTLFRKEVKRFTSSTMYMLNSGFGNLILIVLAAYALINGASFKAMFAARFAGLGIGKIPAILILALICLIGAMDAITAPSINLEGRTIWLLQSMPVNRWSIFAAKIKLNMVVNVIPSVICAVILGIVFEASWAEIVMMIVIITVYLYFTGAFGLMMNLLKPNLTWTNEAIAVKQSISVLLTMAGGLGMVIIITGVGIAAGLVLPSFVSMIIAVLPAAGAAVLVSLWLRKKGAWIFDRL